MKQNNYLIIGNDKEKYDLVIHNILAKIEHTENDLITYDCSTNSFSDVLDEISMPSLFSNLKIVLVNNLDISKLSSSDYLEFSKFLDSHDKTVYLIVIVSKVDMRSKNYKLFKDNFTLYDFTKESNIDVTSYLSELVSEYKIKISREVSDYFLSVVGTDIYNIKNEILKLSLYANGREITYKDIDLLVTPNVLYAVYEFTNAVLDNDYSKIVSMYQKFLSDGLTGDYLIVSLANAFRQSLIIKLMHEDGKSNLSIANEIGKKEFYVKKMLERLYKYTIDDLKRYIIRLAEIDRNYKSGDALMDELEFFLLNKDYEKNNT